MRFIYAVGRWGSPPIHRTQRLAGTGVAMQSNTDRLGIVNESDTTRAEDGRRTGGSRSPGSAAGIHPASALQSVSLTRDQTCSVQISSLERSVIGSRCMLPDGRIFVGSLPQAQPRHAATAGRDIAAGVLCSIVSRRTMGHRIASRICPPCYCVWMMRAC